ncbi:hypothetical protein ACERK3_19415 [Phycisphaerales bacterium AB-hyl4]|uniref:Uncharacterized protein n=1 Tax=Natronomicrosphaera hydrolytica TaxID=3242702 RepID=A0ABV4UAS9_9BACT
MRMTLRPPTGVRLYRIGVPPIMMLPIVIGSRDRGHADTVA